MELFTAGLNCSGNVGCILMEGDLFAAWRLVPVANRNKGNELPIQGPATQAMNTRCRLVEASTPTMRPKRAALEFGSNKLQNTFPTSKFSAQPAQRRRKNDRGNRPVAATTSKKTPGFRLTQKE